MEVKDRLYQEYHLRVSSKERTFIECIDRVEYAGGWEECLKSLENLGGLNFQRIVNLLFKTQKEILLRKVGYVLELLKKNSPLYEHLEDRPLDSIAKRASGAPCYLVDGEPGPLHKRWNLTSQRASRRN